MLRRTSKAYSSTKGNKATSISRLLDRPLFQASARILRIKPRARVESRLPYQARLGTPAAFAMDHLAKEAV